MRILRIVFSFCQQIKQIKGINLKALYLDFALNLRKSVKSADENSSLFLINRLNRLLGFFRAVQEVVKDFARSWRTVA